MPQSLVHRFIMDNLFNYVSDSFGHTYIKLQTYMFKVRDFQNKLQTRMSEGWPWEANHLTLEV